MNRTKLHSQQHFHDSEGSEWPDLEDLATHPCRTSDSRVPDLIATTLRESTPSVVQLIERFQLSRRQLERLFKKHTGRELGGFLLERRMQRALNLLHSSEIPIKQVAYELGYRHPSSFARAFQRRFGMTPTECRRARTEIAPVRKHPTRRDGPEAGVSCGAEC